MSLVAIVAAYIVQRSPVNKMKATRLAVADKGKRRIWNNRSPQLIANRKKQRRRLVGSPRHCPRVCRRDWQYLSPPRKLKESEYYGRNGERADLEISAKITKVNETFSRASREVRDLEREQWVKMAEYLSRTS